MYIFIKYLWLCIAITSWSCGFRVALTKVDESTDGIYEDIILYYPEEDYSTIYGVTESNYKKFFENKSKTYQEMFLDSTGVWIDSLRSASTPSANSFRHRRSRQSNTNFSIVFGVPFWSGTPYYGYENPFFYTYNPYWGNPLYGYGGRFYHPYWNWGYWGGFYNPYFYGFGAYPFWGGGIGYSYPWGVYGNTYNSQRLSSYPRGANTTRRDSNNRSYRVIYNQGRSRSSYTSPSTTNHNQYQNNYSRSKKKPSSATYRRSSSSSHTNSSSFSRPSSRRSSNNVGKRGAR